MTTSIEVTGVKARALMVPLRRPLATSFGVFTQGPFLAIDVETRGGITGHVLAFTFHPLGLRLIPEVLTALATFAKGRSIDMSNMAAFHDTAQKSLMLLGHEGVMQFALSTFDMALHDALAKAAGVPLYKLLGAQSVEMPAYNSCGLGIVAPAAAAKEALELVAENGGYKHVKMRLGRASLAEDIAAVKAVRAAIGPDVALSVDFNQALPAARALDACRAIDGLGLTWIEEPVSYDDYETQARLTRKLATPIQVGETMWQWRVAKRAIEAGACDYLMPDILRIGGVTGWLRVARACDTAGIPLSTHLSPEYSAHVLAASPTRHWLEFMDWGQDLITDPLVPNRGVVRPRETPGAGIEWKEKAVVKCIVSGV